ncbi:PP2C family protein-serine/threonine phosphatase [Fimbriiglobus ruber]|uniref:Serine phosphatase RsbU, regulator of sigma subunit n=1 Tax=Fimbriiglobus ruber TaxID=1908690 RepID=A0A225CYK0_9BACT|nr:PP2C family protein-serine/threonine phosphatase [Fimbriiglobus ruber]OWK34421.1 Serine phosphatase RsbU, regulator of sigma subunit [Fimbriiglobus ruber]
MSVATDFFEITPRNWRARLAVSVDLMRELSRYTDPDEMYHVFARRMSQLYPTARQVSLSRRDLEAPRFRVMRFNQWKDRVNPYKEPHRLPVYSGGLLAELLYADAPRVIDDLHLEDDDPAIEFLDGQRSLLAIPLYEGGAALNMLVVTREESAAFPREQIPELVWMTNLLGRAMQTLVLTDELQAAYETAEYEVRTIAALQRSLLPPAVPQVPGLDVAVHYRAANRAGGDYYDFFPLADGRLGVLVADVSGHGTPAAVLMAITHTLAHAFPDPPTSPGRLLAYLNARLARRYTGATGNFVTAFAAVFDPVRSVVTYANAGHMPPRVAAANTPGWSPLPGGQRLPLGVNSRDSAYPEVTIPLGVGDRVAIFTDGIIEAVNRAGEPFGFDRLDASLGHSPAPAESIVGAVLGELDDFADTPVADDRTLLVVRRT